MSSSDVRTRERWSSVCQRLGALIQSVVTSITRSVSQSVNQSGLVCVCVCVCVCRLVQDPSVPVLREMRASLEVFLLTVSPYTSV